MTEYALGPEFKVVVRHDHQPEPGVDGLALRKGGIRGEHNRKCIHFILQLINTTHLSLRTYLNTIL
jgi:hypothetical protein